ncbi:MAG TPA: hypothetical protein VN808_04145, partial [Stellaceae bacterium]|nr:hypothetical protein [Stellaceae bacterium]
PQAIPPAPKLPDVSIEHLQAWFALYQQVYEGKPADTRPNQLKSAQGMFPDKSVSRDRVRKLFENRSAGRRPKPENK